MSIVRVRILIEKLSYDDLVRSGAIPDLRLVVHAPIATKKYPPWLYDLSKQGHDNIFALFGLFVEKIITTPSPNYEKLWNELIGIPQSPEFFTRSRNYFNSIVKPFVNMFAGSQFNEEITYKNVQGHPDISTNGWILDVKTTTNFTKMSLSSYLQILSYASIAQKLNRPIETIGILLSLQNQILWFSIAGWNSEKYLTILQREAKWCIDDQSIVSFPIRSSQIGCHVSKADDLPGIGRPYQIFTTSPQHPTSMTTCQIQSLKTKTLGHVVYVHAPYTINLCTPASGVKLLLTEIDIAKQIGAKGVVVHVGKYMSNDHQTSLQDMENSIRTTLESATAECPVILETPAGQGTELYTSLESMLSLCEKFADDHRFGICVDTCHVFACGYDPLFYIQSINDRFPRILRLVHFNDSETPRGSRVYRHHPVGLGHIGFDRLSEVAVYCMSVNIPLVME